MTDLSKGVGIRLSEFVRQPTTVGFLVILPPIVIETFAAAVESFPQLAASGLAPETAGRLTGAVFAVAVLAGVVGLFQVISARSGDERLLLCGYSRGSLLASRMATVSAAAIVGTGVAFGTFLGRAGTTPEAPAIALGVLLGAGVLYGLLGVLVGTILPRELEGSLVLVFLVDIDLVASSGFFEFDTRLVELFPLYHPHALFEAAVVDGTLPGDHLWPALAYLAIVIVVAFLAYSRTVGGRVGS